LNGPDAIRPAAVEAVFRAEAGPALATLARLVGDVSVAEDAVQDAFVEAIRAWPARGRPRNPGAWITTTARNRALDHLRRETRRPGREAAAARTAALAALEATPARLHPVTDDQLLMMFTCCHPSLSMEAQVALTLRLVCGMRTAEIARALLQTEPTITKRLQRAKGKIRAAAIPLRVPGPDLIPERVPPVLNCVYLVFSEGYAATGGDELIRHELCDEAIRLARMLAGLLPGAPEVRGLLALLLLHDSRRATRLDERGDLVTLELQDRARWDRDRIAEGVSLLGSALAAGPAGPFTTQAAIAAEHATSPSWEATDWRRIVTLYEALDPHGRSAVVQLNRAVATAFADGPAAGLRLLDELEDDRRLGRSHLLPAARADMLRRMGRHEEAGAAYRTALDRATTRPERHFLERRLAEVKAVSGDI
jgi:RNA polymerase sigma-70 factor (ECF subfamily)